jgi:hypothetical protein
MPNINKSDYLKNYDNVLLTCSVEINGKLIKRGLSINFTVPEGELNFSRGASVLYHYLENAILKENGYYEAVQKEFGREVKRVSNAMKFKTTVVSKVLEDIIKDIPVVDSATEIVETGRLYKIINGCYVKRGNEIPHDVLTQSFMDALHETYEAIEHYKEIVPGIKIADKPVYEETVDSETHDVKRKIRIVFLLPDKEAL